MSATANIFVYASTVRREVEIETVTADELKAGDLIVTGASNHRFTPIAEDTEIAPGGSRIVSLGAKRSIVSAGAVYLRIIDPAAVRAAYRKAADAHRAAIRKTHPHLA